MTIADALKVNSSLTTLYLGCNEIQQEGAMAIAAALKVNSSLASLEICCNSIDQEGALAITDALKVTLSLIFLDHKKSSGCNGNCQCIDSKSSLKSLDLSHNSIHNEGAMAIAYALKVNSTVLYMNLKNNSIHQEGALAITDALKGQLFLDIFGS